MTTYVLDTNTCVYWLKGKEEILRRVKQVGVSDLAITIITLAELKYGAYHSRNVKENLESIDRFLRKVKVLPLVEEAVDTFGRIKADLRRAGKMIDDFDILIGATTMAKDGILVTNNTDHFRRIRGLRYENWFEE